MEKNRIRPVYSGQSMRMSFQRQNDVIEMPNLIDVQKSSYDWFIKEGLREAFDDISPITDYSGNLSMDFVDYDFVKEEAKYLDEIGADGIIVAEGSNRNRIYRLKENSKM